MGLGKSQDMNNGGGFAQQKKVHICGVVLCFSGMINECIFRSIHVPLTPSVQSL